MLSNSYLGKLVRNLSGGNLDNENDSELTRGRNKQETSTSGDNGSEPTGSNEEKHLKEHPKGRQISGREFSQSLPGDFLEEEPYHSGGGSQRNSRAGLISSPVASQVGGGANNNRDCSCFCSLLGIGHSSESGSKRSPNSKGPQEASTPGPSTTRGASRQEASRLLRGSNNDYNTCSPRSTSLSTNYLSAKNPTLNSHSGYENLNQPDRHQFWARNEATMSEGTQLQSARLIPAYFISELMGTFLLVVSDLHCVSLCR